MIEKLTKAILSHDLEKEGQAPLRRRIQQRAMLRDGEFPSPEKFDQELQEALSKLKQE